MKDNIMDPELKFRSDMWAVLRAVEECRLVAVGGQPIILRPDRVDLKHYPLDDMLRKLAEDERLFLCQPIFKRYVQDINDDDYCGEWASTDEVDYYKIKICDPAFTKMYTDLNKHFSASAKKETVDAPGAQKAVEKQGDVVVPEQLVSMPDQDQEEGSKTYPLILNSDGIYYKKKPLKLSPQLYTVCSHLMRHHDNYFTKANLADIMYGANDVPEGSDRTVYTCINKLHSILQKHFKRDVIFNDRRLGYKLKIK